MRFQRRRKFSSLLIFYRWWQSLGFHFYTKQEKFRWPCITFSKQKRKKHRLAPKVFCSSSLIVHSLFIIQSDTCYYHHIRVGGRVCSPLTPRANTSGLWLIMYTHIHVHIDTDYKYTNAYFYNHTFISFQTRLYRQVTYQIIIH